MSPAVSGRRWQTNEIISFSLQRYSAITRRGVFLHPDAVVSGGFCFASRNPENKSERRSVDTSHGRVTEHGQVRALPEEEKKQYPN